MVVADQVRKLYTDFPVASCSFACVEILRQMARDQDFEAVRALVEILGRELGLEDSVCALKQAKSPDDLITSLDASQLLRLYALLYYPARLLNEADLASPGGNKELQQDLFRSLQHLVSIESHLQHEALKCLVLVCTVEMFATPAVGSYS